MPEFNDELWAVPAGELCIEQLHARMRHAVTLLGSMDPDEWALEYGEGMAEDFLSLDTRLSSAEILPAPWRWARTPV